jgi:DNA-binding transcriptional ArsR family regulator
VALHVLIDSKHHPLHIPWVLDARKRISPGLKAEIEAFSLFYLRPIITFWHLSADTAFRTFEQDLQELMALPVEHYAESVLESLLRGPCALREVQQQENLTNLAVERARERHVASVAVVEELIADPVKSRARFVQLLQAFWDDCLQEKWQEIEELMLRDITMRGGHLFQKGPLGVLEKLSPEITVDPLTQQATIRRISKLEITFEAQDQLFLEPSYFAWPHLFVKAQKPVVLNYSIMDHQRMARPPMPPDHLWKLFRALGDMTRLQILQYLAQEPRSTRELASLIGITEATISKHLKQLQESGLIVAKRESYYVFYTLLQEPLHDVNHSLLQFLQLNHE